MMDCVTRLKITRAEAIATAKSACEARGWPWREPVKVMVSLGAVRGELFPYHVKTNADVHGDNPWFEISRTGRLIVAGWIGGPPWQEVRSASSED
jgi:hypothetical protein